jgi:predicted RNase H-like nuclease (RuvC/YqgF family)
MKKPTRPEVAAVSERVAGLWRGRGGGTEARGPEQNRRLERRIEAAETRMEHLEASLEGLQDALYRQARREDINLEELRHRTDPEWMARELSDDARRRGL